MNMIMKQLNFKIVLLFLTIYVCPHRTLAQKDTLLYRTLIQDSILIPQKSQATIEEEEGIHTNTTYFTGGSHIYSQHRIGFLQTVEGELGSLDSHTHKDTICRRYGITFMGYRMGLWKTRTMGNRPFIRFYPSLFFSSFQNDNDIKTEFYSLECLLGKGLFIRTVDLRTLF